MNLFALPDLPLAEELVTTLVDGTVTIERIVSTGQTTDWLDQDRDEFVALLQGQALIEFADGSSVSLSRGDTLVIEAHRQHRVAETSTEPPCIWLCVFY